MAVQLLENWLLKEQEKIQTKYRELNQISVIEPDIIFIGDSIVEYYPLQELLGTTKTIVNRGISRISNWTFYLITLMPTSMVMQWNQIVAFDWDQ